MKHWVALKPMKHWVALKPMKQWVALKPISHIQHLNFVLVCLCLAEHTWQRILLHCIRQCLLGHVSSLSSWLVDRACLLCSAVNTLSEEGCLLMSGSSVCYNPLGPPINLWTMGTVG